MHSYLLGSELTHSNGESSLKTHTMSQISPSISSSNSAFASLSGIQESLACCPSRRWAWSKGKLLWLTTTNRWPTWSHYEKQQQMRELLNIHLYIQTADATTWGSLQVTAWLGQPVAKTQPHTCQHHSTLQHPPATTLSEKQAAQKVLWPTSSLLPNSRYKLDVQLVT